MSLEDFQDCMLTRLDLLKNLRAVVKVPGKANPKLGVKLICENQNFGEKNQFGPLY
jgi:hypothetical protein